MSIYWAATVLSFYPANQSLVHDCYRPLIPCSSPPECEWGNLLKLIFYRCDWNKPLLVRPLSLRKRKDSFALDLDEIESTVDGADVVVENVESMFGIIYGMIEIP